MPEYMERAHTQKLCVAIEPEAQTGLALVILRTFPLSFEWLLLKATSEAFSMRGETFSKSQQQVQLS